MSKHLIIPGDFLKNAGIVGLYYMLKEYNIDILEGREYGIKEQGSTEYGFEPYESGLWLDEDFIEMLIGQIYFLKPVLNITEIVRCMQEF